MPFRIRHRLRAFTLPLVVPMALLASCEEATAPEGKSADVQVRAYIDLDASGSFTTGDATMSNVPLALFRADGTSTTPVVESTTGSDGVATFRVAPGSYTVRLPASGPAGTVLSSSSEPRVVVSSLGTYTAGDIRYAYLPARIAGRIFRDDNANGMYDTTDTPGAGLAVVLRREQGTAPGERVDSTVTDATGAYQFQFLTPGAYYTVLENPTSINFGTSGATRRLLVNAGTVVPTSAIFTGALVADIATARTRANGQLAVVQGAISVRPGSFTSGAGGVNSEIWVQDATGGIAVFSVRTADSSLYALGDRVEVQGALSTFSGQRQIGGAALRVTRLGPGTPPAPVAQTVAQARALTNEGRLVTVSGLRVTAVGGGTGPTFNVTAVGGAGDTITIRSAAAGVTRGAYVVGDRYAITGVLTQFNGTAQIKPRSLADVAPAVATIAAARAATAGTVITVGGNITVPPNVFTSGSGGANSEIWLQDATGGIAVFSVLSSESVNLALGDRVEITGTRGANAGQLQLTSPTVVRVGAGSAPVPVTVTGTVLNSLADEGQLVTAPGFRVTTVTGGTGAAFNVTGTTPDGALVVLRVSGANTGLTRANFVVGQTYAVTGVLSRFTTGTTVTPQLKPRFRTDVIP